MYGQHFSSRVSRTVERISKCCLTSLAERRGTGKAEEPRAEAAGLGFLVAVGLLPELAEPEVGAEGLVVAEHHLPVAEGGRAAEAVVGRRRSGCGAPLKRLGSVFEA